MIVEYVISGMFAVYRKWFSDGQQIPADEVAKKIGIISLGGINALFQAYNIDIKLGSLEF